MTAINSSSIKTSARIQDVLGFLKLAFLISIVGTGAAFISRGKILGFCVARNVNHAHSGPRVHHERSVIFTFVTYSDAEKHFPPSTIWLCMRACYAVAAYYTTTFMLDQVKVSSEPPSSLPRAVVLQMSPLPFTPPCIQSAGGKRAAFFSYNLFLLLYVSIFQSLALISGRCLDAPVNLLGRDYLIQSLWLPPPPRTPRQQVRRALKNKREMGNLANSFLFLVIVDSLGGCRIYALSLVFSFSFADSAAVLVTAGFILK